MIINKPWFIIILDARFVNTWSSKCTHLIASDQTGCTEKVIFALIDGKPIVTAEYIDKLIERKSNPTLCEPNPSEYEKIFTSHYYLGLFQIPILPIGEQ